MKQSSKKNISLKTKAFRVIVAGTLLLIFMISAASFGLYSFESLRNYHDEASNLMDYAMSMEDMTYIEKIFRKTKDIYFALPDDVRREPSSEEFMDAFRPLVDDDFYQARDILVRCWEQTENRNVFLMFTDPELSAIVYVVDGDQIEWAYLPGQWLESDLNQIEEISRSSWKLRITHTDEYGWVGTDYQPITAEDGSQIGYIVIDVDINDFFNKIRRFLIIMIPAAVLMIDLTALLASRLLRKHVILHVTDLAAAAKSYTERDKLENLNETTSHFAQLQINTRDELEDLWRTMTDMENDISDTMRRLVKVTADQEHLNAELSIATEIQVGTLPHTFPAFPERHEFDIYASMVPAKEVGGDFYDFFLIDEDHLALVIADVSGKGISAALFMINAKAAIQNQTQQGTREISEIFANVNEYLCAQNKAEMFVTAWLGILELSTGRVQYANAGHEYPAVRRCCGSGTETDTGLFRIEKDVHSMPLAAMEGMRFRSAEFFLDPGDTLFVYTDGVTEANNAENELFGTERMLQALNREPDGSPQQLDETVREAVAAFASGAPQFDDMTILCLKYFGSGENQKNTDGHLTDAKG